MLISIQTLMEEINTADLIVRSLNRKKVIVENLSYELISPDFSGKLTTAILNLPPNDASSEKVLTYEGEKVAYILEGKVVLHLNEESYILEAGDSVKIPARMNHKWENKFNEQAAILFSITPSCF